MHTYTYDYKVSNRTLAPKCLCKRVLAIKQHFQTRTDISTRLLKPPCTFPSFAGSRTQKEQLKQNMIGFAAYNFEYFDAQRKMWHPCVKQKEKGYPMHN